jgi:hypothetical protein
MGERKKKKRKEKWRDGMEAAAAPPWHQRLLKRSWKRGGGDESKCKGRKRRDDALSRLIDSFPSNMKIQQNK